MRVFKDSKAIRDTNEGKISYYGFRHPLCEHSFGQYMMKHQKCADGSMRQADNWWGGWSERVSIDSLTRHVADLECLEAGLFVYKERSVFGERTVVSVKPIKGKEKELVTKEEAYNAIRFNAMSGLLKHLNK